MESAKLAKRFKVWFSANEVPQMLQKTSSELVVLSMLRAEGKQTPSIKLQ
jgi:hypothetical protein